MKKRSKIHVNWFADTQTGFTDLQKLPNCRLENTAVKLISQMKVN